jgi:hypothetical protein
VSQILATYNIKKVHREMIERLRSSGESLLEPMVPMSVAVERVGTDSQ